ncbi:MAG TPA: FlgD immunoglobulin-like domain containing protein [Spirochaetota bacterium]|nr:FlgD immunoglobulin-like domain containing protein [Spirochaetota bacterium]HPN82717.1 FlgD immunoglobulin-like domain containing protein [Spirochaetota bacterium]
MKVRGVFVCVWLFALISPAILGVGNIGTASPNPLLLDGTTTTTSITVKTPSDLPSFDARVIIQDLSGRRVREYSRGSFGTSDYVVSWDGRNEAGRLVKSGVYIVTVIRRYQDVSRGEETERFRLGLVRNQ